MENKYNFKIQNPIVFFDLETTGVNIQKDRIVEICVCKIHPDETTEVKTRKINPEMHIPKESSDIHGITDEDVANEPTFSAIASSFYEYLKGCDLAGYNIKRFDVPLLIEEFKRAGLDFDITEIRLVDMQTIFHKMEPRTLTAAYKFFCGKELTNAHSAEADVLASVEVLNGQLEKYQDLPHDVEALSDFCDQRDPTWIDSTGKFRWRDGEAIVSFSKHSGTTIEELARTEPNFYKWMLKQSFTKDAKQIAQDALIGKFPQQEIKE